VAQALDVMVGASMFSAADAKRLSSLVQQSSDDQDGGDNMGAPSASVYEGHSGGIVATLTDLLEKAQAQLSAAQNAETKNLFEFQQLKQSIEDEIKYGKKELAEAKTNNAASSEKKATAEGDLSATSADLKEDVKVKADLHQQCMTTAQDFEAEVASRAEELKALAAAKKALADNTAAADSLSYGLNQLSFLEQKDLGVGRSAARRSSSRFHRETSSGGRASAVGGGHLNPPNTAADTSVTQTHVVKSQSACQSLPQLHQRELAVS